MTIISLPTTKTTSIQDAPKVLGFLDLPLEVRLEVYSHLFEAAKLSCDTPHTTWPTCGHSICSCLFPHHIVSTCRQLRDETLPLLMASTVVEVAGSFDKITRMPDHYLGAMNRAVVLDAKLFSTRPFQLEKLPELKVLELRNITVWCKFYDEYFLNSPQADAAMYDMALFNLKRTGFSLIELCMTPRSFKIHLCCQFVINSLSDETIVSTSTVSIFPLTIIACDNWRWWQESHTQVTRATYEELQLMVRIFLNPYWRYLTPTTGPGIGDDNLHD